MLILEKLDHPNIIGCEGHFWDYSSKTLWIVLEYADDGDLFHALTHRRKRGRYLRERDIWHIFMQVCSGLAYLHEQRVVHRDIKSLNILLTKSGQVKIGDLGVGREVSQQTLMLKTFYGTPLYAR